MEEAVSLDFVLGLLSPERRNTVEARGASIIAEEFMRRANPKSSPADLIRGSTVPKDDLSPA